MVTFNCSVAVKTNNCPLAVVTLNCLVALFALLCLFSWCHMIVVRLFLMMPWVCLQFVIMVYPDHTH